MIVIICICGCGGAMDEQQLKTKMKSDLTMEDITQACDSIFAGVFDAKSLALTDVDNVTKNTQISSGITVGSGTLIALIVPLLKADDGKTWSALVLGAITVAAGFYAIVISTNGDIDSFTKDCDDATNKYKDSKPWKDIDAARTAYNNFFTKASGLIRKGTTKYTGNLLRILKKFGS